MEPQGQMQRLGFRIATYTDGPKLKCDNVITTHTIIELIGLLRLEFGPNYDFEPESITEGGIIMTNWPGKIEGRYPDERQPPYKSLRFHLEDYGSWPCVTLHDWSEKEPEIIWSQHMKIRDCEHRHKFREVCMCVGPAFRLKRGQFKWGSMKGTTFLKAFYGAPAWSRGEIHAFKRALVSVGMCQVRRRE